MKHIADHIRSTRKKSNKPKKEAMTMATPKSKTLEHIPNEVHVANVIHHGTQLTIPEGMQIDDAITLLRRRKEYLEEVVMVDRTFPVFPWDGANAMAKVLTQRFGWAAATSTPGFFGSTPPRMINIDVGPNETARVPWGRFELPGIEGYVDAGVGQFDGRIAFRLTGEVLRKDEKAVNDFFQDVATYLKGNSIYSGKAIKIRFFSDDGERLKMPEPKFMDLRGLSRESLVYSQDVNEAIEVNLFTPIERVGDCIASGIPIKRGVLLGGPYGTGKTLAATVAAAIAVANNVTFLYVSRADELADAIEFAKQYQTTACVVFCEDIDRTMAGERSVAMDDILNILDGIDTKRSNIITVLTTNHLEKINAAMLRPGRLDAIINVLPPDAKAVEGLIRLYGKGTIPATENLEEAGKLLDGTIPAVVAEVVKRAKLAQLRLQAPGTKVEAITGKAVALAAASMKQQIDLLHKQSQPKTDKAPDFAELVSRGVDVSLQRNGLAAVASGR